jgi:iron-sulfur cluster assembly protein
VETGKIGLTITWPLSGEVRETDALPGEEPKLPNIDPFGTGRPFRLVPVGGARMVHNLGARTMGENGRPAEKATNLIVSWPVRCERIRGLGCNRIHNKEDTMFTVTERAIDAIKGFVEKQQGSHVIRILSQPGCCGGATLGMALDQPGANDMTFTDQGLTFVIDRDLLEKARPISVDYVEGPGRSGFQLTSNLSGGGGCCS